MISQNKIKVVDMRVEFFSHFNKKFKGIEKEGEKTCTRCSKSKLLKEFCISYNQKDHRYYSCRECQRSRYAKRKGISIDKIRKPIVIIDGKKLCAKCNLVKTVNCFYKNAWHRTGIEPHCKLCGRWYTRIESIVIKMEFIIAYGGKCTCCGISDIDLLTVEHIRDKGHELIYGDSTSSLFFKLKALGWPKGYTVLCYNCNLSTRFGTPCVHSKEYKEHDKRLEIFLVNHGKQKKYFELKHKLDIMNRKVSMI